MKYFFSTKHFLFLSFLVFCGINLPISTHAQLIHSASELDYPPFSIVSENGEAGGFSVELLKASLDKSGLAVDFYVGPWSEIKQALADGKIQVLPLVGRTPERESIFDFTVPYISIYGNIFVRKNSSGINDINDLKDKEVIVMKDDNAEEFAQREKIGKLLIKTNNYEEAFTFLSEGKHDAIITQSIVGNEIIKKLKLNNIIAVSQIDNFKQDYTFAVKEGDEKLLARLNDGLSKIIADGTYNELYNKWLKDESGIGEQIIKLDAITVASQLNGYLKANPEKTIYDLQNDELFKKIAIQKVGKSGYSVVLDVQSGVFYFHPQDKLNNTRAESLKDELPDWWAIMQKTIGQNCKESFGKYKWKEADGQITDKYLYLACVNQTTADGKNLFVAATSYLDESEAIKYLEKYNIGNDFAYAKNTIKQRAFDIAKQIEIFIEANPQLNSQELKDNEEFKKLAVQSVGQSGYTYVINHNTGLLEYHPDPNIKDTSYNLFRQKFPAIWNIINKSITATNCEDSDGFYEWEDIRGEVRDKYTYHHCIDALSADGVKYFIGASTYLDEYSTAELPEQTDNKIRENKYLLFFIYFFSAIIALIILITLLHYLGIINIKGVVIYILLIVAFTMISLFFIVNTNLTVNTLKRIFTNSFIQGTYHTNQLEKDKILDNINKLSRELEYLTKIEIEHGYSQAVMGPFLSAAQERNKSYVYAAYRINKDNIIQNMYPITEDVIGSDLSEQAHMQKIKETLSPVISNIFDAVEGFQAITLHFPVIKNGEYDGSVAFLINIKDFLNSVKMFNNRSLDQESFLFDSNLSIILTDEKDYTGKNIKKLAKYKNQDELFNEMTNATEAGYKYFFNNNEKHLSVFVPIKIKDNSWYIMVNNSEDNINFNINKSLDSTWFYTLVTLFLLAVLSILTGYILTRSLRMEIKSRTEEIDKNVKLINEQLQREEEINTINKKLLAEQKKSKKELESKLAELEKFQKITVNRELKMIELKKKISNYKQ